MNTFFSKTAYHCFKYQEYRFFWIAALFSNIGMWSLVYGRLWLMRTLTDSEIMLGLIITANLAPILLFSLFGGIISELADKDDKIYVHIIDISGPETLASPSYLQCWCTA